MEGPASPYAKRKYADEQNPAYSPPFQEPGQQEHEPDLGHLAEGHLAGRFGHSDFIEIEVGEGVVKLERNAEEKGADHKGGEGSVLQQRECIEPEHVTDAERLAGGVWWRMRQE
jgi:hypothetical protein